MTDRPKIRTSRTKPPPEGFDEIESILGRLSLLVSVLASSCCLWLGCTSCLLSLKLLAMQPRSCRAALCMAQSLTLIRTDEYNTKMRDAENEDHEGKRKNESLWPIMQIVHTRSRWIYDLYYSREAISKELYDWLLKQEYADAKYVLRAYRRSNRARELMRCAQSDSQVEEAGVREAMLCQVYTEQSEFSLLASTRPDPWHRI